jgi:hypothetical protein
MYATEEQARQFCTEHKLSFSNDTKWGYIARSVVALHELKQGDTVEYRNEFLTVGRRDITFNELFGYSFRGDGSKQTITKVQFVVTTMRGILLR